MRVNAPRLRGKKRSYLRSRLSDKSSPEIWFSRRRTSLTTLVAKGDFYTPILGIIVIVAALAHANSGDLPFGYPRINKQSLDRVRSFSRKLLIVILVTIRIGIPADNNLKFRKIEQLIDVILQGLARSISIIEFARIERKRESPIVCRFIKLDIVTKTHKISVLVERNTWHAYRSHPRQIPYRRNSRSRLKYFTVIFGQAHASSFKKRSIKITHSDPSALVQLSLRIARLSQAEPHYLVDILELGKISALSQSSDKPFRI